MTWNNISKLFHPHDKRDTMLRNNIVLSAVLKAIGLSCSLLLVPVTIDYLNSEVYGVWMAMSSILYWFAFFDIGLGNGMRNYLAQSLTEGDHVKGRTYISTTFIVLTGIAVVLGIVSVIVLSVLDMNLLFNTQAIDGTTLYETMLVAVLFTLALFVVKNIGLIFAALQKYAINDLLIVAGSVSSLAIIYILTLYTKGNFMAVVMAFTICPVAVFLLASIPLFRKYPKLRPSFKFFDKAIAIQTCGKGLGFFMIQITSCLVIYGGSNIIITQILGPEHVTIYNTAFKYFNLLAIAYTIIISPMWNAYTAAYVKGDMQWIDATFKKALKMWGVTSIGGIILLAISGLFYSYWIDDRVSIPFTVSASVFIYICCFNLNNCMTYLINGLNKIRVQIYTSLIFTALFLGCVLLLRDVLGIEGIVLMMAACYLLMALIHLYQCRMLIRGTAQGIWNK